MAQTLSPKLMHISFKSWLRHFKPQLPPVHWREIIRACVGAGLGIFLTGVICYGLQRQWQLGTLWIIAPMGASACLIFAAPASPMAQPWPAFAGNTLSALSACCVLWLLPTNPASAGLAVALSLLVMFYTRSLHPPGAATALLAVLTGAHQFDFVLYPVAINSIALITVGLIYNHLTGKSYPHQPVHRTLTQETLRHDLEQVLASHHEVVDISVEDLEIIFEEVRALHT